MPLTSCWMDRWTDDSIKSYPGKVDNFYCNLFGGLLSPQKQNRWKKVDPGNCRKVRLLCVETLLHLHECVAQVFENLRPAVVEFCFIRSQRVKAIERRIRSPGVSDQESVFECSLPPDTRRMELVKFRPKNARSSLFLATPVALPGVSQRAPGAGDAATNEEPQRTTGGHRVVHRQGHHADSGRAERAASRGETRPVWRGTEGWHAAALVLFRGKCSNELAAARGGRLLCLSWKYS